MIQMKLSDERQLLHLENIYSMLQPNKMMT